MNLPAPGLVWCPHPPSLASLLLPYSAFILQWMEGTRASDSGPLQPLGEGGRGRGPKLPLSVPSFSGLPWRQGCAAGALALP